MVYERDATDMAFTVSQYVMFFFNLGNWSLVIM